MKISTVVNKILGRMNMELKRKLPPPKYLEPSALEVCLRLLIGERGHLNIAQVGANDGKINDPIHDFIFRHMDRTNVIFAEPQSYLVEELEKNYEFHALKYIFNGAIGRSPELLLYRVRKDFWVDFEVPYANGWPVYRAPTGITSANYDHVLSWVKRYYRGHSAPEDTIEKFCVECITLQRLLETADLFSRPDLLQVDAEGWDDEVIYASNIEKLKPRVINFEFGNLPEDRAAELVSYLEKNGYTFSVHGIDGLAILDFQHLDPQKTL